MCRCGLEQIKVGGKCMERKGGARAGLWERERRGSWVKWKDGGERDGRVWEENGAAWLVGRMGWMQIWNSVN